MSRTQETFKALYEGTPPWETGKPQQPLFSIIDQLRGDVLDVGCGTGENTIAIAQRGHRVVGVDFVPSAIEKAKKYAADAGVDVEFRVGSALELHMLERQFDSVVDVGLLHAIPVADRATYVNELRAALRPGGRYFLFAFSDHEPISQLAPHRLSEADIRTAFGAGWTIERLERTRMQRNPLGHENAADLVPCQSWMGIIRRGE